MNQAAQLLGRLRYALPAGVRAHGVALLAGDAPVAASGWDGRSWAAPAALARAISADPALRDAPLVLCNDPYAGGTRLDQVFFLARHGVGRVCAAIDFSDFGAMRPDVFCRQREIFHEGLRLSHVAAAPGSGDWAALRALIAANVKHAETVLAALDATQAMLFGETCPMAPPTLVTKSAVAGESPVVTAVFSPDRSSLHLHCAAAAQACAPSTVASAALGGVAQARGRPPWELALRVVAAPGPLAPLPPAAVGDGNALAQACWQAGYAAAGGQGMVAALFAPLGDWMRA